MTCLYQQACQCNCQPHVQCAWYVDITEPVRSWAVAEVGSMEYCGVKFGTTDVTFQGHERRLAAG